jgi:hypothetical protein
MTDLLERAFAEAAKLSPDEQDALAKRWMAELADEQAWAAKFADSQEALAKLAREALAEDDSGLTEDLDPDRL